MGQEEDWNEGPEAAGAGAFVHGEEVADQHVTAPAPARTVVHPDIKLDD